MEPTAFGQPTDPEEAFYAWVANTWRAGYEPRQIGFIKSAWYAALEWSGRDETIAKLTARLDEILGTPCEQVRAEQERESLPILTRITRADRQKVATLLARNSE